MGNQSPCGGDSLGSREAFPLDNNIIKTKMTSSGGNPSGRFDNQFSITPG